MKNQTNPSNQLLAQADLLLLLADMFRSPVEARSRLADLIRDDLRGMVEATGLPEGTMLLQAIETTWDEFQSVPSEAWSDEYHRLFEGAMVCPLNETAYIRRDKGAILGDLAGYYRAFGWSPATDTGEKLDHLITELEFAAVLFVMQANAVQDAAAVTADALASFASDHLSDWMAAVCQQLQTCTRSPFYRSVEASLRLTWQAMLAVHRWPVTASVAVPFMPEADTECLCNCGAEPNWPETGQQRALGDAGMGISSRAI